MTADESSEVAPLPDRQVALIDLLDRLLSGGAVITGDVVLSIADIDLVRISLRALIVSIGPDNPSPWPPPTTAGHSDDLRRTR
ncbi:gas vesicle protein [Streptomyces sp. NBC_01003]|uniref:gas vesicle protein n=1 Tax=Streptomyces sp. NBC_01003 TaxID=2903714 RepID=UPI00386A0071|nr:gas vesicle protein [Streptomyces sp. NBC_01003]